MNVHVKLINGYELAAGVNVSMFVHVSPVMKSVVGQIITKLAKEYY